LIDIAHIVFIYVCVVKNIKSFILGYDYCSFYCPVPQFAVRQFAVRQFPVLQIPVTRPVHYPCSRSLSTVDVFDTRERVVCTGSVYLSDVKVKHPVTYHMWMLRIFSNLLKTILILSYYTR